MHLVPCLTIALLAAAPDVPSPARPANFVIHWQAGEGAAPSSIEVDGIDPTDLAALSALSQVKPTTFAWSRVFTVTVAPEGQDEDERPPILGTYRVVDARLRFEPRFPIEPGLRHRAAFRPSQLPLEPYQGLKDVVTEFKRPLPPPPEPAFVVRVDPASDRLPENLLKFYLHFSAPMSRGEAYARVTLINAQGRTLDVPFLEVGEELWDPSGTRLTLLLDPGRIKRGLKPREDLGPILEAGKAYTLVVDRSWSDATGHPLRESYRKSFKTGPADETQPDPKNWIVKPPAARTSDPLSLEFPESLDRAMLNRTLSVLDPEKQEIPGRVELNALATRWSFHPDRAWTPGRYQVVVDTTLEDLAGNSIARPFEVDVQHPITRRTESGTVSIPLEIRAQASP
ncbi:Ig-like domain-containing protein [Singulisphaera sp. GP187]|uniref:Ig-like domain-containing protein n=1 Tax=Singulisphaera sp. GP187 TaxID=1882752 RepID=UPI0020B1350C|nr:Ig-like domain-containing protein [Singulisphaera sp. GP187]